MDSPSDRGELAMTMQAQKARPQRYHASYGLYLEDFAAGPHDQRDRQYPILPVMTVNAHRMTSMRKRVRPSLVNSGLSLAIVPGMAVNDVSGKAIANLGWKEIKLTAPVFCGDTLFAESEVLEKAKSKSRPTQGIVTVHTHAFNQDTVQVIEFVRGALIPKRRHGVDDTQ
jgi:hypothetical protein